MVGARLLDHVIDHRVVELALARFQLLPVDGDLQRVDMHGSSHGPQRLQLLRPAAGVGDLRAQHEIGLAIDHQGVAAILMGHAWHLLRGQRGRDQERGEQKSVQAGAADDAG